jgi:AcrR family transcriptional regulator
MTERDTKDKIIEAALNRFSDKGLHATKVSDIVKEAGVAQGTFYLYFKNKDDIFLAIVEKHFSDMEQALEKLSDIPSMAGDPIKAKQYLRLLFSELLNHFYRNRVIIQTIQAYGTNSHDVFEICRRYERRLVELIKQELKLCPFVRSFETDDQLEIVAFASKGMFYEIATEWFIQRGHDDSIIPMVSDLLAELHAKLLSDDSASVGGAPA